MADFVLGISAYYHDSAAVLLHGETIVAAAQEERFTRKKQDASFPSNAVRYVLSEAGITVSQLDAISFYDKPYLKFERLLETYHAFVPHGLQSFTTAIPVWIKEKLFLKKLLWNELEEIAGEKIHPKPDLQFPEHHLSHAASTFFPSPFNEAAILTVDGVGEWGTTTICHGKGNTISVLKQLSFPHSIGLLYSAFTYYCGFKVNSGEYKLMGLAPYGNKGSERVEEFKNIIFRDLVDLREDGSILLNMEYFDFAVGLKMCKNRRWAQLFNLEKREPESSLTQPYMDLAFAVQEVTEEIVFRLVQTAKQLTGCDNLVMAGGVALNCVANGKVIRGDSFKHVWIQPAAGDAGGALGSAYASYHIGLGLERKSGDSQVDAMQGSYLGPEYSDLDIKRIVRKFQAQSQYHENFKDVCNIVAELLSQGQVVGWMQGRMEWGPRALGNRSILGDPRNPEMQKKLNLKIKYREGFRPFAPSVLAERAKEYFDLDTSSPYMLLVAPVVKAHRQAPPEDYENMEMYEKLYQQRSDIPAITHVDYSARVQSVHQETNGRYWQLIDSFYQRTACPVVINTSFNVRGEPIVCSPEDAYRCFMRTEMDWLVIGNYIFEKSKQPAWNQEDNWQDAYELD